MKNRVLFLAKVAICSSLWMGADIYGQTPTGQIVGHVTDPNGASVPQAAVTLNGTDTGFERRAATNDAGFYTVPLLPVGHYRISIAKSGFRTVGEADITLNVNQTLTLDFNLSLGQTNQLIEVTGESPLLQAETSELG